ncbi:pseudouridine synthase [Thelephora terrestris]|uniref:Pseudouridine synthase n=1 Tax=Thelephora terrestris TaxID=56493 RepID=A0A9P6HML8_9AGAM|nr:pseudouridine synthase [Thelephora terrestris]
MISSIASTSSFPAEVKLRCQLVEDPWPVHRLDKDTTGALLLARSRLKARELQLQFKERQIKKSYLALVRAGRDVFPDTSGSIRNVLAYDLDGRFQKVVPVRTNAGKRKDTSRGGGVGKSVETVTRWRLLWSSTKAPVSLLSLELETGSKHQLRVHLSEVLNAPILGDPLYSGSHRSYNPADIGIQRGPLYLHSSHISFHNYRQSGPRKRFRVGVTAPLPPYFIRACRKLGIPLTDETIDGGVTIDDVRQDPEVLRKGGGVENGMRWLL